MPFQTASLPRIYRNLGIQEHQPFNTIMDVQRTDIRRRTFDIGVGPQVDILDMKEMDEVGRFRLPGGHGNRVISADTSFAHSVRSRPRSLRWARNFVASP